MKNWNLKNIGAEYRKLNKDARFRAEMLYAKIYAIVVTVIILLVLLSFIPTNPISSPTQHFTETVKNSDLIIRAN